MTAQELDDEGYHPKAGGSKPIMHLILRKRDTHYTYMTWSHDGKEFSIPMILNSDEKNIVERRINEQHDN
jgi:hypothetical protein